MFSCIGNWHREIVEGIGKTVWKSAIDEEWYAEE